MSQLTYQSPQLIDLNWARLKTKLGESINILIVLAY